MPTIEEKRIILKRLRLKKLRAEKASEPKRTLEQKLILNKAARLRGESPEQRTRRRAIEQKEAQQEEYSNLPITDRIRAGAGKTAYASSIGLVKRMMGQGDEVRDTMGAFNQASEGDMATLGGELGADIGLLAIPAARIGRGALKGAQGLNKLRTVANVGAAEGLLSGTAHQVQNIGSGGSVNPLEAGAEVALSTAIPIVGSKIGQVLKKAAPGILQSAVKPARKFMEKYNPPNFEAPFEKGLITKMGGLEKTLEKTDDLVTELAKKRDKVIIKADAKININQIRKGVDDELADLARKGKITDSQYKGALRHSDDMYKSGSRLKSARVNDKGVTLGGKDAVRLRILADKNSKFNPNLQPAEQSYGPLYNEVYRSVLEKNIASKIPEYKKLTTEMGKFIPFGKAVGHRLNQSANNFKLGVLDYASMGVGMGAGGLPGAMAGGMFNRLTTRPGGAKIFHDLGSSLSEQSTLRDLLMQGGRSGAFGRNRGR